MLRVLIAGTVYFAMVFVAAFAFGVVRTLLLEPRIGETLAVSVEIPFLIAVMYAAARWVIPKCAVPRGTLALLGVGLIALALQTGAEYLMLRASGESIEEYAHYLQTTPGLIYMTALGIFALLPLAMWRERVRRKR